MTETAPKENPAKEGPLLEPEEKGVGDYVVPGLIGVAGAALLYRSYSKKKKGKSKKKPDAESNEVKFSKNLSTYSVGKDWKDLVLEPYLAEQAEENNLITSGYMGNITMDQLQPMMAKSRRQVLTVFRATHKVNTTDGNVLISQLPDKSGVRSFNQWLDSETQAFQENY